MASTRLLYVVAAMAIIFELSSPVVGSLHEVMKRNVAKRWCIAYPGANLTHLQIDMGYICATIDCSSIRPGGSCYEPNDIVSHASVVFNLYYKAHSSQPNACYFGGDAMLFLSDPSSGTCIYP
ncbi:glucan endo-1,3-beta-glucosidase-like [Dendrobium catenatum]|uniref:glucan endo-1,3-beta-glucosidase-like n=1 Tax=Dendrobium catenatum TaxID=906689 RepID=UPI0009F537BD|nr:glucan endo-1,3-beta-glucosidase-like [Dendrobium catenatum]